MEKSGARALSPLVIASLALASACAAPAGGAVGQSSAPIIGGTQDSTTTGVVSLTIVLSTTTVAYCTGELIAPNLILTARHCVSQMNQETIDCAVTQFTTLASPQSVYASPLTVRPSDPRFMYRASAVNVPPNTVDLCGNDIALITLSGAGMPSSVTPIVPRIDGSAVRGEVFSAVGFGLFLPDGATGDGTRMRVDGNLVQCMGLGCIGAAGAITPKEWSSADAPTCHGDSGGPALDSQGRVFGLDSRGATDCKGAIYTDVASWKDFIIGGALAAARVGGYSPPFWTNGKSSLSTQARDAGREASADAGPLGASCSGASECGAGFACYSDQGTPPGTCVPRCSASDATCPSGYACATSLGACVPQGASVLHSRDSGGCTVGEPGSGSGGALAVCALSVLAGVAVRRRRARSAERRV